MKRYLESQIAERDQKIASLEKEMLKAKAQRSAFVDALAHLDEGNSADGSTGDHGGEPSAPTRKPTPSTSQMSEHWADILKRLDQAGHSFGAAEVQATAKDVGKSMSVPNVRSQIAYYKQRKVFRRVAKGRYMLTDAGRDMLTKSVAPADKSSADPVDDGAAPHVRVVQ